MKKRVCDYCHREIDTDDMFYELKLEMYAAPVLPDISEEDMEKDHTAEIEALIDAMDSMDVEELTDEVFECYVFHLCKDCRLHLHNKLQHNRDKKKPL